MTQKPVEVQIAEMTDTEVLRGILTEQRHQSEWLRDMDGQLRAIKSHTGCVYAYLIISAILGALFVGFQFLLMQ